MTFCMKKILTISVIICVFLSSGPAGATDEALAESADKIPHPQSLDYTGIYSLRQMDSSLTGSNIKFAVISRSITYLEGKPQNDYRPYTEHNCFKNAKFEFHDQGKLPAGVSPHSTAICSILFGSDVNASNQDLGQINYQGIAPQANADIYEFWHFLINNVFTGSPPDADVIVAGFGSQSQDWWTRGIESMIEQHGLIFVAGIGNGYEVGDRPLYPAAGTNAIGIGVVDSVNSNDMATNLAHFSLAYPDHSSFGPTRDGRCKPDIVACGNCLAANVNGPNSYEPTGNWSSFSTPTVAGTIGLLVQKANQDPNAAAVISSDSGNCVIKAILMNSATKLPYWHKGRLDIDDDHQVPLDFIQGAGMLNAAGAYEHLIAGPAKPNEVLGIGWDLNSLDKDKVPENSYRISTTEPADKLITATAVWNNHYKADYPFEPVSEKNANLRLELWTVDTNDPNKNHLLDYSDSKVDNVEHIYHPADTNYTSYEIIVSFSDTEDANQATLEHNYALAWQIRQKQEDDSIFWYDLNADGIVDKLDLVIMSQNMIANTKSPDTFLLGDININGVIDANDFQALLSHENTRADWYKESNSE